MSWTGRADGEGGMDWTVYILLCGDGTLYTGCTNNLPRRLSAHQRGRGAKYTRSRLPVELIYRETAADKSAALRREIAIKGLTRAQKLALIGMEKERKNHGDPSSEENGQPYGGQPDL